jgi:WhiB family transcriptional regulator, redox-sensing transcriptional regulator
MSVRGSEKLSGDDPSIDDISRIRPENLLDWGAFSKCADKQTDPELFSPPGVSRGKSDQREIDAKAICMSCVVKTQCLEWALANREPGIWGGTNESERKDISKRRARRGRTW